MKVFAVNSSPRNRSQSTTKVLLAHLVDGMIDAGADVEVISLSEKTIKTCLGCYGCWTRTPGKCVQKDDMSTELLPELASSDLVVYATPLYYHTMNALMSTFRERLLPLSQPFTRTKQGRDYFISRHKPIPVVWLSACGFPDLSEFDAFSTFLNKTCHPDTPIVAEIYRTSSEAIKHPALMEKREIILTATRQAGSELINKGKISHQTLAKIQQPLMDKESLAIIGELTWKTCLSEKIGLQTFFDKGLMPRPDSIAAFMAVFRQRINPQATENGGKVIVQFAFSKEVLGACFFTIEKGEVKASEGRSAVCDILIDSPFDLWVDIMTGKADGKEMFLQHKYRVEGDLALMLQLFRRKDYD